MVRLLASFAFAIVISGCGCFGPKDTPKADERVYEPSVITFWTRFRDGDDRYARKFVKLELAAKSYTVTKEPPTVHWHAGADSDPPSIVFEGVSVPDNTRNLTIVGYVTGRVEDRLGPRRWYVKVINCSTSVSPP